MVHTVNCVVLDDPSCAEEKLRASGYRNSFESERLDWEWRTLARSDFDVLVSRQLPRPSVVSGSIARIKPFVISYPTHPYRKGSRYSSRLIESYCPSCELLIAASPRKNILDVMERLHRCPVHYRYPQTSEPIGSHFVHSVRPNVDC